nr:reverse transcriptase domain-containing protein [Tanacetum cinerariifolium]
MNFKERSRTSRYSELRTMSTREYERRHISRRSRSPILSVFSRIKRDRSRSPRQNSREKEGGVFKILGKKRKDCVRTLRQSQPKRKSSREEDDLSQPWVCEEIDPFTLRIRCFDFSKTRMPSNIKTYDRSEDPEDHLKYFRQPQRQNDVLCRPGVTCSTLRRNKLCNLLQRNLDFFAWNPADMTGIPRHIAEHRLNMREGCSSVRQKKRGKAADRNHAIQEEVGKLVEAAEEAFKQMMQLIAEIPMLTAPMENEELIVYLAAAKETLLVMIRDEEHSASAWMNFMVELIVYLAAAKETISAVLMTEREAKQMPIYFVNRALRGPELNYTSMEKLILALVHTIVEEEGDTWITLIFKYLEDGTLPADVKKARVVRRKSWRSAVVNGTLYKKSFLGPWPRCVGPLQANYVLREIHEGSCSMHACTRSVVAKALQTGYYWPTMHKDARTLIRISENLEVYVDDLVIKSRTKDEIVRDIEETFKTLRKINMKLNPKKCTFGVEKGMFLGYKVNTKGLKVLSRPEVAGRLQKWSIELGEYAIHYRSRVSVKGKILVDFIVERPEEDSSDTLMEVEEELSEHGFCLRMDPPAQMQVLVEELKEKFISEVEILAVVEEEGDTWITLIFKYLEEGTLPADVKKARVVRRKSWRSAVVNGTLHKKSFLGPWPRCVGPLQANYVLREMHEGSCSMHAGTRSVVAKALQTGYYWPTMHKDARTLIRVCQDYQVHKPVSRNPQQKLTPITSLWPFYK